MDMAVNKDYMIFELNKNMTKDNRPFIRVILTDTTGAQISGIMFDSNKLSFEPEKGNIVTVVGNMQVYNGQTQLKITTMNLNPNGDPSDFMPRSRFDEDKMMSELSHVLKKHVTTPHLAALVDAFFGDVETVRKFRKAPAAKQVHHAYVSGLLEHTLSTVRLAALVGDYYDEDVNKEHLMLGALFHDLGKVRELDTATTFEYTDPGKLLGHLLLGIEMVNAYCAGIDGFSVTERDLITHMIASHHGYLEFGSPKRPKTVEAFMLHHIDDMDAKINTFRSVFERDGVDAGWSSYDRLLQRQLYRHESGDTETEK